MAQFMEQAQQGQRVAFADQADQPRGRRDGGGHRPPRPDRDSRRAGKSGARRDPADLPRGGHARARGPGGARLDPACGRRASTTSIWWSRTSTARCGSTVACSARWAGTGCTRSRVSAARRSTASTGRARRSACGRRRDGAATLPVDRYRVGMHHLCLEAATRELLYESAGRIVALGGTISEGPRHSPSTARATTPSSSTTPTASSWSCPGRRPARLTGRRRRRSRLPQPDDGVDALLTVR